MIWKGYVCQKKTQKSYNFMDKMNLKNIRHIFICVYDYHYVASGVVVAKVNIRYTYGISAGKR